MGIKNRLMTAVFTLLLSSFFFSATALAEEVSDTLDVVIHRVVTKSGSTIIDNSGKPIDTNQIGELEAVDGVKFTVYEITDQLDTLLEQGKTLEEAQLQLIKKKYDNKNMSALTTITTGSLGGEKGVARFSLSLIPNKKQAYLIQETSTPAEIDVKSDQLVLITPTYSQYGEQMSTVHLYPKNVLKTTLPSTGESTPPTESSPQKPNKQTSVGEFNLNFLPSTGELLQSGLFLLGIGILIVVGIAYIYHEKKKKQWTKIQ